MGYVTQILEVLALLFVFALGAVVLAVVSGAVTSGLGYALWYAVLPRLVEKARGLRLGHGLRGPVPDARRGGCPSWVRAPRASVYCARHGPRRPFSVAA
mgnify:CR=1 FL=1